MKWGSVLLGDIAVDMQPGFACQPTDDPSGVSQLRTNNVSADGRVDLSEIKRVPRAAAEIERYLLRPGDILFNNTNSPALVGKTAFFDEPGEYAFSNHMTRIRVQRTLINPRYAARFLHWAWGQGAFRTLVTQWVNQAAINRSQLASVRIPLPALSEQRRLVEVLDQADHLRRLRAEADAKADRILPALFIKMFGDPGTNPNSWPTGSLRRFGNRVRYGLGQPPSTSENGVPLIRATNIHRGAITRAGMVFVDPTDVPPLRDAFLSPEEVIVVRSGAYTGDVAQVTEEWRGSIVGYDLVVSPATGWTGEFVEQYLLTPYVQRGYFGTQKSRAGQPHLNAKQLEEAPAYEPPAQLQRAFAGHVRALRRFRSKAGHSRERLKVLFATLLARGFTGTLTASWRETRMKELEEEMEQQAVVLAGVPAVGDDAD